MCTGYQQKGASDECRVSRVPQGTQAPSAVSSCVTRCTRWETQKLHSTGGRVTANLHVGHRREHSRFRCPVVRESERMHCDCNWLLATVHFGRYIVAHVRRICVPYLHLFSISRHIMFTSTKIAGLAHTSSAGSGPASLPHCARRR